MTAECLSTMCNTFGVVWFWLYFSSAFLFVLMPNISAVNLDRHYPTSFGLKKKKDSIKGKYKKKGTKTIFLNLQGTECSKIAFL